jgi:hypothetical protein
MCLGCRRHQHPGRDVSNPSATSGCPTGGTMKRFSFLASIFVVLLLFASPSQAQVWRSSSGNIFRFQPGGNMTVIYSNGGGANGSWWWVTPSRQSAYYGQAAKSRCGARLRGRSSTQARAARRPLEPPRRWMPLWARNSRIFPRKVHSFSLTLTCSFGVGALPEKSTAGPR